MTTTRIKPVVVTCLHGPRAQCALCSDADPRWREWRVGMGLHPWPNAPKPVRYVLAEPLAVAPPLPPPPAPPKRVRVKPRPAVEPVEDDVYAYWEAHPGMTFGEALSKVRRLQRAVV